MPTFQEILSATKKEIREISVPELQKKLTAKADLVVVDVREPDETAKGVIPKAILIPRGFLELKIEEQVPDKNKEIVVHCAGGVRSALAAKSLQALGYKNVSSLAGGYDKWVEGGGAAAKKECLNPQQADRYSRHVILPEVGVEGQLKLLRSKVLLIGAGGLGSPTAYYLAAAGIGTLGIIDNDVVDRSNLQRQILHSDARVGIPKVHSAKATLEALNPDVRVIPYHEKLTAQNIFKIMEGYDIVVDGCDNFPTRYLVNDACVIKGIPNVHGSIYRFEGQTTVFAPGKGPCYRCLFPVPPPPELAPSCQEAGVFGVLPGIIGTIQGVETIKLLLGIGDGLAGRFLIFDALKMEFRELKIRRDPACPVCGEKPTITALIDYEWFCAHPFEKPKH